MYNPATSSGSIAVTAGAVVSAMPGLLCNVILNPGSAASSVTLYDNASAASGTVLWSAVAAASTNSVSSNFSIPVAVSKGIYIVVAGTAATAVVTFTQGG